MELHNGNLSLLPPAPGLCQRCAQEHDPNEPHDATSLYYQTWFQQQNGRPPTWNDALSHCGPQKRASWLRYLGALGIDPDSTNVMPRLADAEIAQRLEDVFLEELGL